MMNCAENVRTRKRNITLNPLVYSLAEEAHLDPCESFRVGAFIAILNVLSSDKAKRTKAYSEDSDALILLQFDGD